MDGDKHLRLLFFYAQVIPSDFKCLAKRIVRCLYRASCDDESEYEKHFPSFSSGSAALSDRSR